MRAGRRASLLESLEWRLAARDGEDWFRSVVAGLGDAGLGRRLLDGSISIVELQQRKDWAKRGLRRGASEGAILRAALAYYLMVAAALRHHELLLSQRPWARVVRGLSRLAPQLPAAWRELFREAARRPEALCVRGAPPEDRGRRGDFAG